jgi:hypothetical protein
MPVFAQSKSLKALAFFNDFVRKQLIPKKLILHTQYTSARKKGISLLSHSERCKDLRQTDLCKNLGKTGSLPCPFKEYQFFFFLETKSP